MGHKNKLPPQTTSFIGREAELHELQDLLTDPACRLLTLTGPGGVGKTRLALQVADHLIDTFVDGVFFIGLSPIGDPDLVAGTIAQVVGVSEVAGKPVVESLKRFMRGRDTLLVVDSFEQVTDAAPLIGELLNATISLKIMVTSRAVLSVYGEHVHRVPPLRVPDDERPLTHNGLLHFEAPNLFVQRAKAARSNFEITEDNVADIAEICRRLDGLPLAIELAAARARMLSPKAMLQRLDDRFKVLTSGARNLPERLQTLRGAIDWSYDLLTPAEKQLFARLAVFQGGRTLEAVEAVCNHDLGIDILDGLESLLNKSLVSQHEGLDGEPRFFMLESIQEYACEQLEASDEAPTMRHRHAAYFAALADQAAIEMRGPRQAYWSQRLNEEYDNLRAVLMWSPKENDPNFALRLVCVLGEFWYYSGRIVEGRKWVKWAAHTPTDAPPLLRVQVLYTASMLAFAYGDYDSGRTYSQRALELAREHGDRAGEAWALLWMAAHCMAYPGEVERGLAFCEDAVAIFQDLDDKSGTAWSLNVIGEMTRMEGDYDRASRAYEESAAVCRAMGDRRREAIALVNLGSVARHQGDFHKAEAVMLEGLAVLRDLDLRYHIAIVMGLLAGPVAAKGQWTQAAHLLGASEAIFEEMGIAHAPADQQDIEQCEAFLRQKLGDEAVNAAWDAGRKLTLQEATAYALAGLADFQPEADNVPASEHTHQLQTPIVQPLVDPLSERELEVLFLLAQRWTNQEIASELSIALGTVKTHVHNICSKLHVAGRRQAVTRARELQILPV